MSRRSEEAREVAQERRQAERERSATRKYARNVKTWERATAARGYREVYPNGYCH